MTFYLTTCVLLASLTPEAHSAAEQAESVLLTFQNELAPVLEPFTIVEQDFRNANGCLRGSSTALRARDALHLAVAAGRDATLCSLDQILVEAALGLGFAAPLIRTD